MQRTALVLIAMLFASAAMAQATGPRLLRDGRSITGVAGVGTPCDVADMQCQPYSATGVVTKVDRERDDTLASFALRDPSGNVELQNFDETHEGLSRNDKRDLGRWLKPGLKVTVSGTTTGGVGGAIVDSITLASEK